MEDITRKIDEYRIQCLRVGRGHYEVGESLARQQLILGGSVTFLSTLVATALFATLSNDSDVTLRILAGTVAAATAVISALETFLGLSRRAEAHKTAGSQYGSVRRELEILSLDILEKNVLPSEAITKFKEISSRLSDLADSSPHLPRRYYDRQVAEHPAMSLCACSRIGSRCG
jgi:SMODS and SLOG-associating 2TM effector domain family 4